MTILQPEADAWGAHYLALRGAEQAGELEAAQELLMLGTPGYALAALYPADGFRFCVDLAACSPLGSRGLDRLEGLNWRYESRKFVSGLSRKFSAIRMVQWQAGYKAELLKTPLAQPYGGRRSSLHLAYRTLHILDHWQELSWEERGQFYEICRELDEVLTGSGGYSPARWLSTLEA